MPRSATLKPTLLTTKEAAIYLSLKPGTLEKMRLYDEDGPAFVTLCCSAVRYRPCDLDAYAASRVDRSISARQKRLRQQRVED
ncbi:hypothetical protein M9978_17535 [Sphingomonas sp. MG17]|uniref:Helix-turn-helix domain-containing protein n=1 Tax=Sphingomonas tagetis TaxID=2949092 RepID=A0A9X2HJ89_9SPHN|nr:hypothetical protein [Sphingomonas tagetis]MCP3732226.1 hypothetical protein [Sphingomonas tagetis]